MTKVSVLVVCTGNICRSPLGEWILRAKAETAGLDLFLASGGTNSEESGNPASRFSVLEAQARGYETGSHKARRVEEGDFARFDLMLGMTRRHMHILETRQPAGSNTRIAHFMEHGRRWPDEDVPDPWGGSRADYAHAADMIEDGAEGWIDHFRQILA